MGSVTMLEPPLVIHDSYRHSLYTAEVMSNPRTIRITSIKYHIIIIKTLTMYET